ncbi:hypothetical protein PO587_38950 [Streptomyces gilvifuscus]|uniref:Vegetative cell wall protein gp1 n=1 Tax=Streptomyces gilvifuscus TaxID=1550617 RepID=A0ABT5G6J6_9ACTN|nr:hypothetical protein [Streptomyces gilvifuscus]MDC2960419.1 hypothetical protein [Streptomyces gilvifuscus]
MNSFLQQLAKKFADQWFSLLILPGAMYLAVAGAAAVLRQRQALDVPRLVQHISHWASTAANAHLGGQIILLIAVLAAAAGVSMVVQMLAVPMQRLVLSADWRLWPAPLRWCANKLVERRKRNWRAAARRYDALLSQAAANLANGVQSDPIPRETAYRAMAAIGTELPDRPTWSGDRMQSTASRLDRDLQLDLGVVWPHLWLVLPESARTEISEVRKALDRATALGTWALPYAVIVVWWWPAALICVALVLSSWWRTRQAAQAYAEVLEAAVRVHVADLASRLGLAATGPFSAAVGGRLTDQLTPRRPNYQA